MCSYKLSLTNISFLVVHRFPLSQRGTLQRRISSSYQHLFITCLFSLTAFLRILFLLLCVLHAWLSVISKGSLQRRIFIMISGFIYYMYLSLTAFLRILFLLFMCPPSALHYVVWYWSLRQGGSFLYSIYSSSS